MAHNRSTRSGRSINPDPFTMHGQPPIAPPMPLSVPQSINTVPAAPINQAGKTLMAIKSMLESVPPTSPFEKNLTNCVNLLIAQMLEIKHNLGISQSRTVKLSNAVRDVQVSNIKTEQYSRRDCLTVTGLVKAVGESQADLGTKIIGALNKSGVAVKAEDLSAYHRNGGQGKEVKLRDGTTKIVPPSITVKFKSVGQKDDIVKNYKNFDSSISRPAVVQVYHSLTPHYSGLRREILTFFRSPDAAGKEAKWARYLSPSAGLAIKLKSNEFMKNIHTFDDFITVFNRDILALGNAQT